MKTKRRSRWSRILAIVLAMTMVLCDQSVIYASDSMADPVAEEAVTEPVAEKPVQEAVEEPAPEPIAEEPARRSLNRNRQQKLLQQRHRRQRSLQQRHLQQKLPSGKIW